MYEHNCFCYKIGDLKTLPAIARLVRSRRAMYGMPEILLIDRPVVTMSEHEIKIFGFQLMKYKPYTSASSDVVCVNLCVQCAV